MSNREKIIIGLMIVTIAFGIYNFTGSTKKMGPRGTSSVKEDLQGFITQMAVQLKADKISDTDQYIVQQAGKVWTKDPFIQARSPLKPSVDRPKAAPKTVKVDTGPNLRYTGYLQIGDKTLAIINGMEYEKNDALDIKGLFLKDISTTSVVIGKVGGSDQIRIPLIDTGSEP